MKPTTKSCSAIYFFIAAVILAGCGIPSTSIPTSSAGPEMTREASDTAALPADTMVLPTGAHTPKPPAKIMIMNENGYDQFLENNSLAVTLNGEKIKREGWKFTWYRNGTWFYQSNAPELSNEKMKTFLGFPQENTPPSSHADHTIRGYSFKVEVSDASGEKIGEDEVRIGGIVDQTEMRGVILLTLGPWHINEVGIKPVDEFKMMKSRLNNNWVSINVLYFQDGLGSSKVYRRNQVEVGNPCSIDDETLIEQINGAHEAGLKVILYPQVWLVTPEGWGTPGNREQIVPTSAWFDSYREYILNQARIAEENHVELLTIGVELLKTQGYTEQWRRTISEVRSIYSGPITYSAIIASEGMVEELRNVPWLADLDFIGLSGNIEYKGIGKDPRESELVEYFEKRAGAAEKLSKYFNKPVVFLETGANSMDGTIMDGPQTVETPSALADYQEQADYYDAFLKAFSNKPWNKAIMWNSWFYGQERWFKSDPMGIFLVYPYGKFADRVLLSWNGG